MLEPERLDSRTINVTDARRWVTRHNVNVVEHGSGKRDDAVQKLKLQTTSKDYEKLLQRRSQLEAMRGFGSNEAAWRRQRHTKSGRWNGA
jgi:hypothetical protein